MAKIIYTHTDEAPLLATYSLLPIIQAYAAKAGVDVETRDISLAGRIIANFPERLTEEQRIDDALAELGDLAKTPEANIIKLPNISASIPQLKAAIKELQEQGLRPAGLPRRPEVRRGEGRPRPLRQGEGQRREPGAARGQLRPPRAAVGEELRAQAPALDGRLERGLEDERRAHDRRRLPLQREVGGDRRRRLAAHRAGRRRRHDDRARESVPVLAGEVIDATVMRVAALREFLTEQIARAKAEDVLFSVHLKATMMKVSDPIIFGHVVQAFFPEVFAQYGETLAAAGLSPNDGLGAILTGDRGAARGRGDQGRDRAGHRRGSRAGHGRLRQGHHQPARAQRRDRRRLDAGHDPHLRPHVGPGRQGGRHPRGDPGQQLRRHLPGRHRRLPRPTAPTTRPRWARSPTWA